MTHHKEGLTAALDFTKFTLAMNGAAILYLLGSDTLKTVTGLWAKSIVIAALASFGISAIGGIFVLMAGATNLSDGNYDLHDKWLCRPGLWNIFGLMAGFAFLTIFVISLVWFNQPSAKP